MEIEKEENSIKITAKKGWMRIYLNQKEEQHKDNIRQFIMSFLRKRKKYDEVSKSMKEITREECKKIILDDLEDISLKKFQPNGLEDIFSKRFRIETLNEVWSKLEEEIFGSENFMIEKLYGSFTYTVSIVYVLKKDSSSNNS